jgi:hypothetical protein
MIAHVVLFRPRATLTAAERERLADAFSKAIREIPSVRRAQIGERVTHGRPYEALMATHYSHAAILEFDDVAGLRAYLEHPAHEALGRLFFEAFEEAIMYDFAMTEGAEAAFSLTHAHQP